MKIIALVVVIVSISKPEEIPNITVTSTYNSMDACQSSLDDLKNNINAIEINDGSGNRILKMYNREYHKQGIIYWVCKESKLP